MIDANGHVVVENGLASVGGTRLGADCEHDRTLVRADLGNQTTELLLHERLLFEEHECTACREIASLVAKLLLLVNQFLQGTGQVVPDPGRILQFMDFDLNAFQVGENLLLQCGCLREFQLLDPCDGLIQLARQARGDQDPLRLRSDAAQVAGPTGHLR